MEATAGPDGRGGTRPTRGDTGVRGRRGHPAAGGSVRSPVPLPAATGSAAEGQPDGERPREQQRHTACLRDRSHRDGRTATSIFLRARQDAPGERSGPKRRKRDHQQTERQQGWKCRRRNQRKTAQAHVKSATERKAARCTSLERRKDPHLGQTGPVGTGPLAQPRKAAQRTPHVTAQRRTARRASGRAKGTPPTDLEVTPARLTENWEGKRDRGHSDQTCQALALNTR